MVSSQTKLFLVLLQLSHLCLGSYSFLFEPRHRHHHNHPRPCGPPLPPHTDTPTVKPPVNPPTTAPTNPPVVSPINPPVNSPISLPTISPTSPQADSPANPPAPTLSPIDAPVISPVNPPITSPIPAPVNPLTMPPAETPATLVAEAATPPAPGLAPLSDLVAVQGDVYCTNCSRTIDGAKPLAGATVVLTCMNGFFPAVRVAMTDKDGHFFVMAPTAVKYSSATSQCTVYLLPVPPLGLCSQRSDLNGGISGAQLEPQETFAPLPYSLFTVGPFTFEPPRGFCTDTN